MNIRVADIQACYELWKSRGAEFITEPKAKYGETRCYIRDPDGYIIEVGQSTGPHVRLTLGHRRLVKELHLEFRNLGGSGLKVPMLILGTASQARAPLFMCSRSA